MSKKDLNEINYILAVVNKFNDLEIKIKFNCYIYIIDRLKEKNIDFKIIKEELNSYDLIIVNLKNYTMQLELTDRNKLKVLYIAKKAFLKGDKHEI